MQIDEWITNILNTLQLTKSLTSQIILVGIRAVAIIIPPVQGWIVDLVILSLVGPIRAFIITEIGLIVGSSTAFGIARKFREPLLSRFVSIKKIHKWESTLSEKEKFWSWVLLRLPSNIFFDYISYAAGLTKCTYKMFIFSTIIGSLPSVILFYVISSYAFKYGGWLYGILAAVGLVILGHILFSVYRRNKNNPSV